MNHTALIRTIQSVLSRDLLSPAWAARVTRFDHRTSGHCYAATEALWHLMDPSERAAYCVMFATTTDDKFSREPGLTHWWLAHRDDPTVRLDPTAEQYAPEAPPYHLGRKGGFLTKEPSKRAQRLMARVKLKVALNPELV